DVNQVRLPAPEQVAHPPGARHAQTDLLVEWQRLTVNQLRGRCLASLPGPDHIHLMATSAEGLDPPAQGARDAVDLGRKRLGNEPEPQGPLRPGGVCHGSLRVCVDCSPSFYVPLSWCGFSSASISAASKSSGTGRPSARRPSRHSRIRYSRVLRWSAST